MIEESVKSLLKKYPGVFKIGLDRAEALKHELEESSSIFVVCNILTLRFFLPFPFPFVFFLYLVTVLKIVAALKIPVWIQVRDIFVSFDSPIRFVGNSPFVCTAGLDFLCKRNDFFQLRIFCNLINTAIIVGSFINSVDAKNFRVNNRTASFQC